MEIRVKLEPGALMPVKAHTTDAGYDLHCYGQAVFHSEHNSWEYSTGVSVEIPEGYVGLIFPRSSIKNTALRLANAVGVVDSGYQGVIRFFFDQVDTALPIYEVGDRIGQLVIMKLPETSLNKVDSFTTKTKRGTGGFGSSGR